MKFEIPIHVSSNCKLKMNIGCYFVNDFKLHLFLE